MSTIVREGDFRVSVYAPPREHAPPHVHVRKGHEGSVVIRLQVGDSPVTVRRVIRLKTRGILRARKLVTEHHEELLRAWREMHGQERN
ncbi:MAG: DUF4160 domain-containing protein [Gemmatimonadetes bacterium]|nr:DUF4160 domain-containing protein [Gemmatimonadota bacterium]